MACVFVELGHDVHIDGDLTTAVNEGVRRGYEKAYLRKSITADPLQRVNTGDNTPAFLTVHLVPGDGCQITVAPKGAGSENMSRLTMLKPADGVQGVKDFVLDTVKQAGGQPLPTHRAGHRHRRQLRPLRRTGQTGAAAPAGCAQPGPVLRRAGKRTVGCHQRYRFWPPGLWRCHHLPGRCH